MYFSLLNKLIASSSSVNKFPLIILPPFEFPIQEHDIVVCRWSATRAPLGLTAAKIPILGLSAAPSPGTPLSSTDCDADCTSPSGDGQKKKMLYPDAKITGTKPHSFIASEHFRIPEFHILHMPGSSPNAKMVPTARHHSPRIHGQYQTSLNAAGSANCKIDFISFQSLMNQSTRMKESEQQMVMYPKRAFPSNHDFVSVSQHVIIIIIIILDMCMCIV